LASRGLATPPSRSTTRFVRFGMHRCSGSGLRGTRGQHHQQRLAPVRLERMQQRAAGRHRERAAHDNDVLARRVHLGAAEVGLQQRCIEGVGASANLGVCVMRSGTRPLQWVLLTPVAGPQQRIDRLKYEVLSALVEFVAEQHAEAQAVE
jgi:hypothetical protein